MNYSAELQAIQNIAEHSDFVRINRARARAFAKDFRLNQTRHWSDLAPFNFAGLTEDQALNFIFIVDSTAFCYWGEPKWTVSYRGKNYDGFFGVIAAVARAFESGTPILDPHWRAAMSVADLAEVLRGNVEIPLLAERFEIISEIAKKIVAKYHGNIAELVASGQGDALKLVDLLAAEFPSYEDSAEYKGQTVHFLKRANLTVNDIKVIFKGQGIGAIKNLDLLLGRADYKIPQIMRKLGILEYVPELAEKVDHKIELTHNDPEEIEIRANMLWALELIRQELLPHLPQVTQADIDDYLWTAAQTKSPDDKPYHRSRTTAY